MSNAIAIVTGAVVLATGGLGGWSLRAASEPVPRERDEHVASDALATDLGLLRSEVRAALDALREQRTVSPPTEVARTDASAAAELDARMRRLEERIDRVEPGRAERARPHAGHGEAGAGFASLEEILAFERRQDALGEAAQTTEAYVEFRDRVQAAYEFWSLDDVLARHGRPTRVYAQDVGLVLVYVLMDGEDEHDLTLVVCEGRVVSASF